MMLKYFPITRIRVLS